MPGTCYPLVPGTHCPVVLTTQWCMVVPSTYCLMVSAACWCSLTADACQYPVSAGFHCQWSPMPLAKQGCVAQCCPRLLVPGACYLVVSDDACCLAGAQWWLVLGRHTRCPVMPSSWGCPVLPSAQWCLVVPNVHCCLVAPTAPQCPPVLTDCWYPVPRGGHRPVLTVPTDAHWCPAVPTNFTRGKFS